MLDTPHYSATGSDLAVLTSFFNPGGSKMLLPNYLEFAEGIRRTGCPLYTVECAFGDADFQLPADGTVLQVRADCLCWQKERLLNLLEKQVPPRYSKLAWIDADVVFDDPSALYRTSRLLNKHKLVQLFSRVDWLDADRLATYSWPGVVSGVASHGVFAVYVPKDFHPGMAWAIRRDIWSRVGLFDRTGTMAGDIVMAAAAYGKPKHVAWNLRSRQAAEWYRAWYSGIVGNVGFVPGEIRHLWHGDIASRQYVSLQEQLDIVGFDNSVDLVDGIDGTLTFPSHRADLVELFSEYFKTRTVAERSVDLSIITATRNRHDQLASRLRSVQSQTGGVSLEHVVVVDGADDWASVRVCQHFGVSPVVLPISGGVCGATAKDTGLAAATGRYVAIWDDDDIYHDDAASRMLDSVRGFDIGVCKVGQFIPRQDSGGSVYRELPTAVEFGSWTQMSMAVRRELAVTEPIYDGNTDRGTDWRWYQRLLNHNPRQNFSDALIGCFVDTYQLPVASQ